MAALAGFLASKIQPDAGPADLAVDASSASELSGYDSEASYSWDEVSTSRRMVEAPRTHSVAAVTGWVVREPADAFAGIEPVDAVQLVPASRWDLEAHTGETAMGWDSALWGELPSMPWPAGS